MIMNKKSILIVLLLILGLVVIFVFLNNNSDLNSNDKNIIGEKDITKKSYGYPLIRIISENNKEIEISAGIYRFGDINEDGIVGKEDIDALKIMINTNNVGFSTGQVHLADVNEDGKIDNNDLELFNKYLTNNGEVKYDISSNLLSYCLTYKNDSSTCDWQSSFKFIIKEEKDYYAFVKQNINGRTSDVMKLKKDIFKKLEI